MVVHLQDMICQVLVYIRRNMFMYKISKLVDLLFTDQLEAFPSFTIIKKIPGNVDNY